MKRHYRRVKNGPIVLVLLLLACGCTRSDNQGLLFQDEFNNSRSGWGKDQREEFKRGYEGGEDFIELYEPNWFTWAHPGQEFDDVSVEVETHPASGSHDLHFGLLCRHADMGNFYYFAISADGYYVIFRRAGGGDLEALTAGGRGMTPSSAIKTGEQVNHVRAVCQGNELSLYVNGELLATVTDDTHTRGDVGIGGGSGPAGEARIQFDDFIVTEP